MQYHIIKPDLNLLRNKKYNLADGAPNMVP